jgi:hypothetical protein
MALLNRKTRIDIAESSKSAEGAAVELANGMLRNVRQNVM